MLVPFETKIWRINMPLILRLDPDSEGLQLRIDTPDQDERGSDRLEKTTDREEISI